MKIRWRPGVWIGITGLVAIALYALTQGNNEVALGATGTLGPLLPKLMDSEEAMDKPDG